MMSEAIKTKNWIKKDNLKGMLFILPAFLLLLTFGILPLILSVIRSFQDYTTKEFVGFDNFDYIFKTPSFMKSFINVILFTILVVIIMVPITFLFAHTISKLTPKWQSVIKTIIYIPGILSGIVVSIMFTFILNYGGGLISSIFISNGKEPIAFMVQGYWPIVAIIVPTVWLGFGYNSLLMYASLINIPKEYFEAAEIDGAGFWGKLFYITIPNMKNTFIFIIITLTTGTLQMLEIPYFITGGGPLEMTLTPALYLFNSFRDINRSPNVTIAGALIIMIVIVIINAITFRLLKSKETDSY